MLWNNLNCIEITCLLTVWNHLPLKPIYSHDFLKVFDKFFQFYYIKFFLRNCSFKFLDKSQKHCAEWKKLCTKEYTLYGSIYMKSWARINKYIKENRKIVSSEGSDENRKWLGRYIRILCWVVEMYNNYSDRGLGYTGICICQNSVNVQLIYKICIHKFCIKRKTITKYWTLVNDMYASKKERDEE